MKKTVGLAIGLLVFGHSIIGMNKGKPKEQPKPPTSKSSTTPLQPQQTEFELFAKPFDFDLKKPLQQLASETQQQPKDANSSTSSSSGGSAGSKNLSQPVSTLQQEQQAQVSSTGSAKKDTSTDSFTNAQSSLPVTQGEQKNDEQSASSSQQQESSLSVKLQQEQQPQLLSTDSETKKSTSSDSSTLNAQISSSVDGDGQKKVKQSPDSSQPTDFSSGQNASSSLQTAVISRDGSHQGSNLVDIISVQQEPTSVGIIPTVQQDIPSKNFWNLWGWSDEFNTRVYGYYATYGKYILNGTLDEKLGILETCPTSLDEKYKWHRKNITKGHIISRAIREREYHMRKVASNDGKDDLFNLTDALEKHSYLMDNNDLILMILSFTHRKRLKLHNQVVMSQIDQRLQRNLAIKESQSSIKELQQQSETINASLLAIKKILSDSSKRCLTPNREPSGSTTYYFSKLCNETSSRLAGDVATFGQHIVQGTLESKLKINVPIPETVESVFDYLEGKYSCKAQDIDEFFDYLGNRITEGHEVNRVLAEQAIEVSRNRQSSNSAETLKTLDFLIEACNKHHYLISGYTAKTIRSVVNDIKRRDSVSGYDFESMQKQLDDTYKLLKQDEKKDDKITDQKK